MSIYVLVQIFGILILIVIHYTTCPILKLFIVVTKFVFRKCLYYATNFDNWMKEKPSPSLPQVSFIPTDYKI